MIQLPKRSGITSETKLFPEAFKIPEGGCRECLVQESKK